MNNGENSLGKYIVVVGWIKGNKNSETLLFA